MSAQVRLALQAQIQAPAAPQPAFTRVQDWIRYWNWVALQSAALQQRIPNAQVRKRLLQEVWYESVRAALDPDLVLGLIQVESGFNRYALSSVQAMGLMQVMPFWTRQVGDGHALELFSVPVNLRYGCTILRHYLDEENGNLFMALGRYNGSRGQPAYPDAVLSARRHFEQIATWPATPASAPQ